MSRWMWWFQPWSCCSASTCCRHAHLGAGVAGERGREGPVGAERVRAAVVGHPQPVDAPHVLPPADHLADEPLGRRDAAPVPPGRRASAASHHLARQEQAEVEVRAQHRVGEVPAGGEHGVLVRAEDREQARATAWSSRRRASARLVAHRPSGSAPTHVAGRPAITSRSRSSSGVRQGLGPLRAGAGLRRRLAVLGRRSSSARRPDRRRP